MANNISVMISLEQARLVLTKKLNKQKRNLGRVKDLVELGITVEIFIDCKKQELISELRDNDFIIEKDDHKNNTFLV